MAQPRDRGCDQPTVPDPLGFRDNLGFQERSPGLPGPPGRGIDARVLEDLADS
jgi:hypothetical protein